MPALPFFSAPPGCAGSEYGLAAKYGIRMTARDTANPGPRSTR